MSEDADIGRDSLGEAVTKPKEFRDWLLFKRHFGAWSIAPPDGFVYRNDEPVPESVQVIEYSAYLQAIKERDDLKKELQIREDALLAERDAELERLKKERHDIKCPHCQKNFWFVQEYGQYPNAISAACSHQELLAEAEKALEEIAARYSDAGYNLSCIAGEALTKLKQARGE